MYDRRTIKKEAKQLMRESVPHFMLVALVYYLLSSGLQTAANWLTGNATLGTGVLSVFLNILVVLFGIVIGVGFSNYALRLARREENGMNSLFHPFSFAGRALGATLLTALYIFLWGVLLLVAFGLVTGFWAFLAPNIPLMVGLLIVLYLGMVVLIYVISLRYAMVPFALVDDPDAGAMNAIRRSVQMMRGHKGKYFVLNLSFLGWEVLVGLISAVVLGVGLWFIGTDWFVSAVAAIESDPWVAYFAFGDLTARLAIWSLLAELLSLPLSLWLLVYRQTAAARFYNYVCGYDYHQYMNARQVPPTQEPPQSPGGGAQAPRSSAPEDADAPEPPRTDAGPERYYNSILPPEPEGEDSEPPKDEK